MIRPRRTRFTPIRPSDAVARPGRSWSRRTALVILLAGGAATWALAQSPDRPASPAAATAQPDSQTRLHALYATLTVSLTLVVLLIFGVLIIKQAGRRATEGRRRRQPTEYVDAWSNYRLSNESTDDRHYPEGEQPYDEDADSTDETP